LSHAQSLPEPVEESNPYHYNDTHKNEGFRQDAPLVSSCQTGEWLTKYVPVPFPVHQHWAVHVRVLQAILSIWVQKSLDSAYFLFHVQDATMRRPQAA